MAPSTDETTEVDGTLEVAATEENEKIDDQTGDSELAPAIVSYDIASYGADFDVEGLVKRLQREDIVVPIFQREYVWDIDQASRFIESLLLGLPIPGIFLSRDFDGRLVVIDGQQRLRTLQYFFEGKFPHIDRPFKLRHVQPQFERKDINTLDESSRRYLNDAIIHATIITQEQPKNDDTSLYHIFERLNTGGTPLVPQEIRYCVGMGAFTHLLDELNQNPYWREAFGRVHTRMRDRELILRFLSLHFWFEKYSEPMQDFLTRFLQENRHLDKIERAQMSAPFENTIKVIIEKLGPKAFRPRAVLNAAVMDSLMIGVSRNLDKVAAADPAKVSDLYLHLMSDADYTSAVKNSTSRREHVERRIGIATEAFAML